MSKIRIKLGVVEIEYEGSDGFLKDELPGLLDKLYSIVPPASLGPLANGNSGEEQAAGVVSPVLPTNDVGTTSSIAADLGAKTGPDLALAAAARLTFGLDKASFTRKELLAEMQTATSYYNKNMSGNLSKMISAMIKDRALREVAKDTFALSADKRRELEGRFGS